MKLIKKTLLLFLTMIEANHYLKGQGTESIIKFNKKPIILSIKEYVNKKNVLPISPILKLELKEVFKIISSTDIDNIENILFNGQNKIHTNKIKEYLHKLDPKKFKFYQIKDLPIEIISKSQDYLCKKEIDTTDIFSMISLIKRYVNEQNSYPLKGGKIVNKYIEEIFHNLDINRKSEITVKLNKILLNAKNKEMSQNILKSFAKNLHKKESKYILHKTLTKDSAIASQLTKLQNNNFAFSSDNIIKIFDSSTDKIIHTLTGHTKHITTLITLSNNNIASGSSDNTIKIWDSSTGKVIHTLTGHTKPIIGLVMKSSNKIFSESLKDNISSESNDTTIKIWNSDTGKLLQENIKMSFFNHQRPKLIKLPNGNYAHRCGNLLYRAPSKNITIFDYRTRKLLDSLTGHKNYIRTIIALQNNNIVSESDDNTIKIWKTHLNQKEMLNIETLEKLIKYALQANNQLKHDRLLFKLNNKNNLNKKNLNKNKQKSILDYIKSWFGY